MGLVVDLLSTLPEGEVLQVVIGLHWTAVVTSTGGRSQCGLASTLVTDHEHNDSPDVPDAGHLEKKSGLFLAEYARSESPLMRSIGVAAINSLLPVNEQSFIEQNAGQAIVQFGAGKHVVLVGRFPFIPELKAQVGDLTVLEENPLPGELPADSALEVIPDADVVAITGMTLLNRTLENLLSLCAQGSFVILLGPSAPLSPVLFDHKVDLICGSIVDDVPQVLLAVRQAANFRQVHQAGVRLVSMSRERNRY